MSGRFKITWYWLSGFAALALCATTWAQSNIVSNGGFDGGAGGWDASGILQLNSRFGLPVSFVTVHGALWQDVRTVVGRDYVLKVSLHGGVPQLSWGGAPIDPFTEFSATNWLGWYDASCHLTATEEVTRLQFENVLPAGTPLDNVRLGWAQQPIRLLSQPESRAGLEGAAVTFAVVAEGGPPLSYQWSFDGTPMPGATSSVLTLTNLRSQDAGTYWVAVSNAVGGVVTAPASLTVEQASKVPLIVFHPESRDVPIGYPYNLRVAAIGEAPLEYQWTFNGMELANATNSTLAFTSIQFSNAGIYTVRVSNSRGSAVSLPATLQAIAAVGGGYVKADNLRNLDPLFDLDGVRPLGSAFSAQLYVGSSIANLRAMGMPISCVSGFFPLGLAIIPDVPEGQTVLIQVRVWEVSYGQSYEEARARGGKFGFSSEYEAVTYPPPTIPPTVPISSFPLRAGVPFFSTGRIQKGERLPDGTLQWVLTGEPGFRYLIERRDPSQDWVPLIIVENLTGTVVFTDPNQKNSSAQFYRARMLD